MSEETSLPTEQISQDAENDEAQGDNVNEHLNKRTNSPEKDIELMPEKTSDTNTSPALLSGDIEKEYAAEPADMPCTAEDVEACEVTAEKPLEENITEAQNVEAKELEGAATENAAVDDLRSSAEVMEEVEMESEEPIIQKESMTVSNSLLESTTENEKEKDVESETKKAAEEDVPDNLMDVDAIETDTPADSDIFEISDEKIEEELLTENEEANKDPSPDLTEQTNDKDKENLTEEGSSKQEEITETTKDSEKIEESPNKDEEMVENSTADSNLEQEKELSAKETCVIIDEDISKEKSKEITTIKDSCQEKEADNEREKEKVLEEISVEEKKPELNEKTVVSAAELVSKEDKINHDDSSKTEEVQKENPSNDKEIESKIDEPMEIMDTCLDTSQESTNLVIDETPEVIEAEAMGTGETITEISEIDKTKNTKSPEEDDKEKEEIQKESEAAHPIDDDVIPIEQPPMPIIEIDDDDDEDDTSSVPKSTEKESEKPEEQSMEVDEGSKMDTPNETTKSVEESPQKETQPDNDLLNIAHEKPMEEVLKDGENTEDTTDEVFYNKECINYECLHKHKQFFRVPQFAFSYFKVNKKKFKTQYICSDCYDKALDMFEEYCGLINAKQPLLMEDIPSGRQEFVEIIDSSDEEDTSNSTKVMEPVQSAFSKNDLFLIEQELHNTIKSVLDRVEMQNQLTWSKTILSERLNRLEMETDYVDSELRYLQRKSDKMHEGLYSCPKIKIRQLQPLDLNSGKIMGFENMQSDIPPIPPVGEIERPSIQIHSTYYAVKNNAIASWVPCKVVELIEGGSTAQKNIKYYRIRFLKTQYQKTVPSKYLAYFEPPTVRLPIGTRVIAFFDATSLSRGREKINVQSAYYPGIIAEPLKPNNKFRYLIFYDDGYTQYVYHKNVRLVCHVSENVWEDVHPASRDFIQKYLTQYSINRPMVQTQKGQSMNTESNGYWLHARVIDIDCSLVLMQFEGSKSHTEWIYRGSLRLGPVFKEYQKTLQKNSNVPVSRLPRRTEPFIRYTEDEESAPQQQQQQQQQAEKTNEGNRAVARKTFGRPESMMNSAQPSTSLQREHAANVPAVKHLNNSTIYLEDEYKPNGKVVYYTAKRNLPPRKYVPHVCSPGCLFEVTHNLSAYSPLSKPLLSGWERFIIRQKIKKVVTYRAPCGKILRNMTELHHYLRTTNNVLNVDNFDFSPQTNCLAEYVIDSAIIQKRDISCGQEKMAIPLVNSYDNTLPPECKYSAKVIPTEGVHINKDPEFFAGCDCDDDCSDKTKCSCWQLTIAGAKYGNPNTPVEEVGYQYKRLLEHVPTGIYECNPRCKCKQNCLNRVAQHSLQLKLQVFKTNNRGWGLRCINDVPRGAFVCVYAGHLLTEAKANEGGQDAGDEYFAELDYIEVAEQIKEGYESDVEPPEPDEEENYQPELDDDDFTPSKSFLTRAKRQNATKSGDDSQERQVINFNPNADMNEDSGRENSIRKLYGKDEACYVMDAKISGNLGRYFNHSCAPNMFVQNVFVDTHDLRFPWVAFFASSDISAGTELTWNYNYEVGVVPGKVLYCQCGASTCRLRLL